MRLCEPVIVPFFGERDGQEPRAHSVDEPLPTVTSHGAGAVVEPYLVDMTHGNGSECPVKAADRRAHSLDKPLGTITTAHRGEKALVEPVIVKYNGTGGAHSVDAPLGTITTKDRYALVMPDGSAYGLDIRLRMLRPHELAAAMSLRGYKLVGTLEQQVKQIGNAVPGCLAKALCLSLLSDRQPLEVSA